MRRAAGLLAGLAVAPADLAALDPALRRALTEWGPDTARLPGGGEARVRTDGRAALHEGTAPFRTLETRVPPQG